MFGQILTPEECIPILLDRNRSPVIALDTEFETRNGEVPTCHAPLRGLSLAGGTPATGIVGAFWSFGPRGETTPFPELRDRVLRPIFRDEQRTVALHPAKTDMQVIRRRGLREEDERAKIACTMSMLHIYDENMPKGLKDTGGTVLNVHDLASHAKMQKELKALEKEGERTAKDIVKAVWAYYAEHRQKSKEYEAAIDLTWPGWQKLAASLPPGLKKAAVEDRVSERVYAVVRADFLERVNRRFALYGAEDALLTLGTYYFLMDRFARRGTEGYKAAMAQVLMETAVCHPVTTEMEEAGLKIDVVLLGHIHDAMKVALEALRVEVVQRWGIAELAAPVVEDHAPAPGELAAFVESVEEKPAKAFNPASTDQVAHIIWNVWQLRPPPYTMRNGELQAKFTRKKDGLCSTDADILEYLAANSPEPYATNIKKLLDLRGYEKIMGTYVISLLTMALADPEHRIHSSFWPVGARTGRFSSSSPNVENVPRASTMPEVPIPAGADPMKPPIGVVVWKEKDKKTRAEKIIWRVESLRKVFIAEKGFRLVSVDLSQVENRLTAHESQDPGLLKLYRGWDCFECKAAGETDQPLHACPKCGAKDGKRDKTKPEQPAVKGFCLGRDIHAFTSVMCGFFDRYGYDIGREHGKPTNHAATYGMSPPTMSRQHNMPIAECENALELWHKTFPYVRILHERVRQKITNDGFVVMFDGHMRRFPLQRLLLRSNNFRPWEWEGTIREGVNVLAQGGTGIIMKIAMPRIRARLRELGGLYLKVRLVNQVHDELIYESPAGIADEVLKIACWELEHAVQLTVPIIAEGKHAERWGDAH